MDNMNGDWDAFEERVRKNPMTPDECYSEQRHNPYKANCFKSHERFWTKKRIQEWLINVVALGIVMWVLLSLSSCGGDRFKIERNIKTWEDSRHRCQAEACMITEVRYEGDVIWSVYRTVDATDSVHRLDSIHAEWAVIAFKKFIKKR